jgi:hypothetical protein
MREIDPIRLFSDYLTVTGVAHIEPEPFGDPELVGKRLGLLHGSSWITFWANYFGRLHLPGVHLVNVGNEAVQINFMEAHARQEVVPPRSNIDAFIRYALDLVELARVDAVLLTCSTMNRAYLEVREALSPRSVPVVQIDRPMMERAVEVGGRLLVVATHGPTVKSTKSLLRDTAAEMGSGIESEGLTVEEAWHRLSTGDVLGHNQILADRIRGALQDKQISAVVLAQLSMTVFLLSFKDPIREFGVPVLTSGQYGFERVREVLSGQQAQ